MCYEVFVFILSDPLLVITWLNYSLARSAKSFSKFSVFFPRYDNEYGYSHRVVDLIKYLAGIRSEHFVPGPS